MVGLKVVARQTKIVRIQGVSKRAAVDLLPSDSAGAAVDAVIACSGRIDGFMHTVGGYRAGTPIHETPVEDWDFLMNLNARSVFITNRAVIPHMLE